MLSEFIFVAVILSLWMVGKGKFGLLDLVWYIYSGRFGLIGLVW